MKKVKKYVLLLVGVFLLSGCAKIPAGYSGIKVKQWGSDKGVEDVALVTGRVIYNPLEYDIFEFPKFMQTVVWTSDRREGSREDESFTIQTNDGLDVRLNVGLSYQLDESKIPALFEKFRKEPRDIEAGYLRTKVRNYFLEEAANYSVEDFVENKDSFLKAVEKKAKEDLIHDGFIVDTLSIIGSPVLPETVINSIESKIRATQQAQQKERELQSAKADAAKRVAEARGKADSKLIEAEAEAKANKLLANSVSGSLIEWERIKKWNGVLPQVSGVATPLIDMRVK